MSDLDIKHEVTELTKSPSNSKETRKLQHWKTSYWNNFGSNSEHSENSEGTQSFAPKLNVFQQRMAKRARKVGTWDTKRKRTQDDDITFHDNKVHRDSSWANNHRDGSFNESQRSPQNFKSKRRLVIETDPSILARRQKQIDYGKNTICYDEYRRCVPKDKRQRNDPSTPPKNIQFSRRAWDGLIKVWRQKLHSWDPPQNASMSPDARALPKGIKNGAGVEETAGSLVETQNLKNLRNRIKLDDGIEDGEMDGSSEDELCIEKGD
ncbi:hypothetical protein R5R35_007852 [Gryllus longicercus]|uniref:Histone RNA hairpin-binding protein RNA-binding domain-containing protein n=1 Tax=Gryllus longicercus TaxID=2509291 RepID=A0AAN9V4C8_9ORTH